MATAAVLRSHDVLDNRMHLEAFGVSPASKPRRRRHTKPASPPPKMAAVSSPPVVKTAPRVTSPPPKAAAAPQGRRSPPARPVARKQGSPTKEFPKQRLVMEEIRILKRGEEPPVPSPSPAPVAAQASPVDQRAPRVPAVAQAAPTDQKAPRPTRSKQQQPAAVPRKIKSVADAPGYAGPAFSSASPEPSSLPFPAFIRRAEAEATRGLRCLLRIGELP
uniref:Uncharacterized protein n=1 Tax=Oryza punctata TaxID=4537 RepID=A0A0E0K6C2_ORYPU